MGVQACITTLNLLAVGLGSNNTHARNIGHFGWAIGHTCFLQSPFVDLQFLPSKRSTAGVDFPNQCFNCCTRPISPSVPHRSLSQIILTETSSILLFAWCCVLAGQPVSSSTYKHTHLPLALKGYLWSFSESSKCGVFFLTVAWSLALSVSPLPVSTSFPS